MFSGENVIQIKRHMKYTKIKKEHEKIGDDMYAKLQS